MGINIRIVYISNNHNMILKLKSKFIFEHGFP